jgi:hypothetical protein
MYSMRSRRGLEGAPLTTLLTGNVLQDEEDPFGNSKGGAEYASYDDGYALTTSSGYSTLTWFTQLEQYTYDAGA